MVEVRNQMIAVAPEIDEKPKSRLGLLLGLFILSMVILVFGSAAGYFFFENSREMRRMRAVVFSDVYYTGTVVAGVDVSGMTRAEAEEAVNAAVAAQLAERIITVSYREREWALELPGMPNTAQALDEAYAYARTGTLEERYALIEKIARHGRLYYVEIENDLSVMDPFIKSVEREFIIEPVNAALLAFDHETKTFTYSQEMPGYALDAAALEQAIDTAVRTRSFPIRIEASAVAIAPSTTQDTLSASIGLLSSFDTKTTSDSNRNANIALASASFDGLVLMPGEVFSFNETTGKRTAEKGYKEAGAIRNGKDVKEIGGGVCQVSTTLFNAAVRAGLTVVERNNHSYPISYVPRGTDAMVDYPGNDLQLRNDGEGPVYFSSHFEENILTIEVHGMPILDDGVSVELNPVTTATIAKPSRVTRYDDSAANGARTVERKGRDGYRVTTYIRYIKDGEVIREEELFKSNYAAISELVIYGTRQ